VTKAATRRRRPRCRCSHAATPVEFSGVGVAGHQTHRGGLRSHRTEKQAPPSETTTFMAGYTEPGLEARRAAAASAREKALAKLKARTPLDPAVQAERIAAAEARENMQAEKRALLKTKKAQELAEKADRAAKATPALTEAERKAARDVKYAARKARKK